MPFFRVSLLAATLLLSGCASTSGYHNPQDPFEPFNRGMYTINDKLDRAVVKPVAQGYNAVMPTPGKILLNNFFSNIDDILVTVNDVLQLKLVQAVNDGGRFAINTVFGGFGLVDLAGTVGGLEKHHEDFGQTLGYWGIASGPYLVLPVLGPSSVRDGVGLYVDSIPNPINQVRPIVSGRDVVLVTDGVRRRANLLEQEGLVEAAELDRYTFLRDAYLSHRESMVYDGHPPRKKHMYDEDEDDSDTPPAKPAPQSAPPAPAPAASAVPAAPAQ